jgi:hypothetical protein
MVLFGPETARAIDRYLRARRQHPRAGGSILWLGERGRGFGYDALHRALRYRAELPDSTPTSSATPRRAAGWPSAGPRAG